MSRDLPRGAGAVGLDRHLAKGPRMHRLSLALLGALTAFPAGAEPPAYLDDRSTPEAVIASYFNAMTLQDFPRAWSYLDEGLHPSFEVFFEGYADIARVDVRTGPAMAEGAAGTTWWQVPVTLRFWTISGTPIVNTGCFTLRQPRPELTDRPPYRPIVIASDAYLPVLEDFETAEGRCPG